MLLIAMARYKLEFFIIKITTIGFKKTTVFSIEYFHFKRRKRLIQFVRDNI